MHILRKLPLWLTVGLLVYMPFHIFLSQSLSLVTGGLNQWKIAKDILLLAGLVLTAVLLLVTGRYKKDKQYGTFLLLAFFYGLMHLITWRINANIDTSGALLATAYNSRLAGFALLAWGSIIIYPGKINIKKIFVLVVAVSTVVSVIGILQLLLPKDILTHFGYSLDRGVRPNFFIDDKPDLPRIFSTLRDPNSLGAYLILPITLLSVAWAKLPKQRSLIAGLLLFNFWALFLTFSRSAWAGTILSICLAFGLIYKDSLKTIVKKYWRFGLVAIVAISIFIYAMRDQYAVQNIVFHSDENTQMADSNNLHVRYAKEGVEGIMEKPLGHGPGTAGLVSIHSKKEVVLTENYFIQIGYEVGLIGLGIFIWIIAFILIRLYSIKTILSAIQFSAFFGISLCALLLLTWSNEAVAATWWLLAGLLVGCRQGTLRKNLL